MLPFPLGCNPDIFRRNVAVNVSVTTSCDKIHPAFNSLGKIQWTCVDHLTWREDFTECTMLPSYNKSILLFLYQVEISPNLDIASFLEEPGPLEQDVRQLCVTLPSCPPCPYHALRVPVCMFELLDVSRLTPYSLYSSRTVVSQGCLDPWEQM